MQRHFSGKLPGDSRKAPHPYWKNDDKFATCLDEKVDVMIDDDYKIIKKLNENGIKALYFRDTNLLKLPETDLMHEVNNWGDVYRYICENK